MPGSNNNVGFGGANNGPGQGSPGFGAGNGERREESGNPFTNFLKGLGLGDKQKDSNRNNYGQQDGSRSDFVSGLTRGLSMDNQMMNGGYSNQMNNYQNPYPPMGQPGDPNFYGGQGQRQNFDSRPMMDNYGRPVGPMMGGMQSNPYDVGLSQSGRDFSQSGRDFRPEQMDRGGQPMAIRQQQGMYDNRQPNYNGQPMNRRQRQRRPEQGMYDSFVPSASPPRSGQRSFEQPTSLARPMASSMSNMAREVRTNKNYYPAEGRLGLGSDANLYSSTNAAQSRFGPSYGIDPQPYAYNQQSSFLSEIVPDTERPSAFTSRYDTPPQLGSDASLSPRRNWSRDSAQTSQIQDASYLNYLLPDTDRTSAFTSRYNDLPRLGSDASNSSPSRPRQMNYVETRVLGSDASNSSPSRPRQSFNPNDQFSSQTLNPSTYQGDVAMNELTALSSSQYRSNDRYSNNNSFPSTSSPRTPSQLSGIASGYGGDMGWGGYDQGQMGGGMGMNQNTMGQGSMGGSMGQGSMGQMGGMGMDNGYGMGMDNGYGDQDNW